MPVRLDTGLGSPNPDGEYLREEKKNSKRVRLPYYGWKRIEKINSVCGHSNFLSLKCPLIIQLRANLLLVTNWHQQHGSLVLVLSMIFMFTVQGSAAMMGLIGA